MHLNIRDNLLNVCVRVFYKRSHSYILFYEVRLKNRQNNNCFIFILFYITFNFINATIIYILYISFT